MGRTYLFECSRCAYRARVSGRADKGFTFSVQTILCRDCKSLYDAVVHMKMPELSSTQARINASGFRAPNLLRRPPAWEVTPTFNSVLNRLAFPGAKRFKSVEFKMRCPVSAMHRVQIWNEPGKCPKCGLPLEKHPLPYRIWD